MRLRTKYFFVLIAIFATTLTTFAQNTGSNSPYGRYGFGLLSTPSFGASEAMGGISYGLRRSQQVNPGNPASFSMLDTLTFIFDFGVSGHRQTLSDGINQRTFFNGNLDYIAIQFPLWRNMGASVGLLPFSKVGYNFGRTLPEGGILFSEIYRGTGGLSEIYGGVAWELFRNFSVGVNVSYLFGNFAHTSTIIPGTPGARVGQTQYAYSIRTLRYNLGLQKTFPVGTNRSVTFGAVYSPQISTTADVIPTSMLFQSDPFQNPWQFPEEILPTDTLRDASFQFPHKFGAGFTYSTNRFLVGFDGEFQLWQGLDYPDVLDGITNRDDRFNNTFRLASGVEYVINPMGQRFLHRVRFRGGVSFGNSYANIKVFDPENGSPMGTGSFRQFGVNAGLGLPFRDFLTGHMSMINIGFGYTRHQPNHRFMIAQDTFRISINVNFNEWWFRQHQFH